MLGSRKKTWSAAASQLDDFDKTYIFPLVNSDNKMMTLEFQFRDFWPKMEKFILNSVLHTINYRSSS